MFESIFHRFFDFLCGVDYKKPINIFVVVFLFFGLGTLMALLISYWSIITDLFLLTIFLIVKSTKNNKDIFVLADFFLKRYNKALKKRDLFIKYLSIRNIRYRFWWLNKYISILYYLILISKTTEKSFDAVLDSVNYLYFSVLTQEEIDSVKNNELSHEDKQKIYDKIFHAHKYVQRRTNALSVLVMTGLIVLNILAGLFISLIFPAFLSHAATFHWVQTDWSTGVTANNALHTTDQSGWTEYSARDDGVVATDSVELSGLPLGTAAFDFTNSADYVQEDDVTGTQFVAGVAILKSLGSAPDFPAGGTDHSGADWTPDDGSTITGTHYNVGVFTITTGYTVYVGAGVELAVSAVTANIDGILSANGKGDPSGTGNGGAGGAGNGSWGAGGGGGGGAGYGAIGGNGSTKHGSSPAGGGGTEYGGETASSIYLGSNGGDGGSGNCCSSPHNAVAGAVGGGAIHIKTSANITASGSILANGNNGSNGYSKLSGGNAGAGGSGGGSGGGIVLEGDGITMSGILSANGGNGGDGGCGENCKYSPGGGGGGGAGGRIKLYYSSINLTGSLVVTGGSGGQPGTNTQGFTTTGATGANGTTYSTVKGYTTATASYVTSAAGSQLDTSTWASIEGISFTQTIPTDTSIKYLVSFDDRTTWKYWDGSAWVVSSLANLQIDGMDASVLEALSSANWAATGGFSSGSTTQLDVAADLMTLDGLVAPSVDNIDVSYKTYASSQTLTSSPYNTNSSDNTIGSLSWTESLPTNTDIKFQIRTAVDSSGSPGVWGDWLGPTSAGDYYTDPTGNETINSLHSDTTGNQWVQYKVWLLSDDGLRTPTLSDVTFTYVVNAAPEVQSVTAVQNSDGTVSIIYQIKDVDTSTGTTNSGYITPSFQYWNGSSWAMISTLATGDIDNKVVTEDSFTEYSATWEATTDYSAQYMNNTAQIRVIANDNEAANNTGSGDSATFTLDTKIPAVGANPILIDASVSPASLILSANDDSSLEMKISLNSDLSGASWVAYDSSPTISLVDDPEIVYVQFADALSNTSIIYSITTPETPTAMMVQDTSNIILDPDELRLFIAWKVVDAPAAGFADYKIYKSSDGTNYSLLYTETDRTINYYGDSTTEFDTLYYYKTRATDLDGNVSFWSSAIMGKANGIQDAGEGGGGSETTAPVISNVGSGSITTSQATITWTTTELSDSLVEYITSTGGDFTMAPSIGSASMKDTTDNIGQHSVVLTGLSPNTTYYYQVLSTDSSSNRATDKDGTDGYSFTTLSGAVITDTSASEINNTSATFTWSTDSSANSYVAYSVNSDMSDYTQSGSDEAVMSHEVTISGLSSATKYYYYVTSGPAIDNNGGDYYSFTTTFDNIAPTITFDDGTDITELYDTSVRISWTTDEAATSAIYYDTTATSYGLNEVVSDLDFNHSIKLTNLTPSTTYYFKLISLDKNDNTVTDNNGGIDYTFVTINTPDTNGPEVSAVATASTSSTGAVVTWSTSEVASSFVQYYIAISGFVDSFTEIGRDESVTTHSVSFSNLSQNQQYYYRVRSVDASGNETLDDNSGEYYTFTTVNGPAISSVSSTPGASSALITWTTDVVADSYVIYDTNSDFSDTTEVGTASTGTDHSVTIPGLTINNTYYFKVRSTATDRGTTTADNSYSFITVSNDHDAPVLSAGPSTTIFDTIVVINWTTDEAATSQVEFGTVSGTLGFSTEEDANLNTTHSVTISSLTADTLYYYHIISRDESDNTFTSDEYDLTTLETLTEESAVQAREQAAVDAIEPTGGGGVLFIEVDADKIAPTITNISIIVDGDTGTITWITSENADSFVEYGNTAVFGIINGDYNFSSNHSVKIYNIGNYSNIYFRVASKDKFGNLAISQQQIYNSDSSLESLNDIDSIVQKLASKEEKITDLEKQIADLSNSVTPDHGSQILALQQELDALRADRNKNDQIIEQAKQSLMQVMNVISELADNVSISVLESVLSSQYDSIEQMGNIIPAPILSGEPRVSVLSDSATISWSTDKDANSLIAIAPVEQYKSGLLEPYLQVVGNSNDSTINHSVVVYDLEPETDYYYQLRSQGKVGSMAKSRNFSFRTLSKSLTIENYFVDILSNEEAKFTWVTNVETDSELSYTPYRDGELSVEEKHIKSDGSYSVLHEVVISDFEGGVVYNVELAGTAINGSSTTKSIPTFVTSNDDYAPVIFQVQTSSAISPGSEGSIQTIISWQTNELATSQVFYSRGMVSGEEQLLESTREDNNYTKKHVVVITKFEPGIVYSFQVESIDSTGNRTRSKMFTILTPRQQATVFDVIKNNFVDVFGWTSKLRR